MKMKVLSVISSPYLQPLRLLLLLLLPIIEAQYSPPLNKIWDTRRVPYDIDSSLDANIAAAFLQAVEQIESETCVRFGRRESHELDYINVIPGTGCESYVGRKGLVQRLHLNLACASVGAIMHELVHSLGFYHEHQRPDRDQYITVHTANIEAGQGIQFRRRSPLSRELLDWDYDYKSITHYGEYAFSANNQPTITVLDASKQNLIGNDKNLSTIDILKIQQYYNCNSTVLSCPDLSAPDNASIMFTSASREIGTQADVVCDDGYRLIGPKLRTCRLDGSWTAYQPDCMLTDSIYFYCSFTNDTWCGLTRSQTPGSLGNVWFKSSLTTVDDFTGPTFDHTSMSSNGNYTYVASTLVQSGDTASLETPIFIPDGSDGNERVCFRFAYSMYGQYIGNLKVRIVNDDGTESVMFDKSGGQGPYWKTSSFPINTDQSFKIRLTVTFIANGEGDVALDDLLLTRCSNL